MTSLSFYFHDVLYASLIVPDVQVDFRKGRGTRNQIVNICWINNKARESRKKICFIDYAKAFDCVDHNQLWKIIGILGSKGIGHVSDCKARKLGS